MQVALGCFRLQGPSAKDLESQSISKTVQSVQQRIPWQDSVTSRAMHLHMWFHFMLMRSRWSSSVIWRLTHGIWKKGRLPANLVHVNVGKIWRSMLSINYVCWLCQGLFSFFFTPSCKWAWWIDFHEAAWSFLAWGIALPSCINLGTAEQQLAMDGYRVPISIDHWSPAKGASHYERLHASEMPLTSAKLFGVMGDVYNDSSMISMQVCSLGLTRSWFGFQRSHVMWTF